MESGAVLGKIILCSVSSYLSLDWKQFFEEAKKAGVPNKLIPMPTPRNKSKNVLETKEFRRGIVRVIESANGIPFRGPGGVMFLPTGFTSDWEIYAKVLDDVDDVVVTEIEVANTEANKNEIVSSLISDLECYLKLEIMRLANVPTEGDKNFLFKKFRELTGKSRLKVDATNHMYDRLIAEKAKIMAYQNVLGIRLDDLIKEMDETIECFKENCLLKNKLKNKHRIWECLRGFIEQNIK